ncbi:MAG: hypothetical protein R6W93_05130 [Candidatus Limnocylindrales bacterium]
MTSHDDLDRRLTAWLDEEVAMHAPIGLLESATGRVARARPLPGWATTERWISMETRAMLGAVPRVIIVLATIGLLAALTAGTIAIGAAVSGGSANGLIVYQHASGDLWTVEHDGSDPRPLVESDATLSAPAWSPDGRRVAYWSTETGGRENALIVSDADGSDPIVVASDIGEITGWALPDWSPDGTRLAFTAATSVIREAHCSAEGSFCGSRLFVAASDGTTGAVQTGDPGLDARTAAWSPDGSTIAFGAGDTVGDIRLHVMDADGSNVRQVSDLQGETWALLRLDWSPDGTSIVGTSGHPAWDIWVFPTDGGRESNVSAVDVETRSVDQLFPTYAPDGAIAWWRGGDGLCECLTIREGATEPVELTGGTWAPAWSPDGQFIVTQRQDSDGELIIIDRSGAVQATIDGVGDARYGASWQNLGR